MIVTPDKLHHLRAEARRHAADSAIAIEDAKDRVAREYGYSTWAVMLRQIESPLLKANEAPGT